MNEIFKFIRNGFKDNYVELCACVIVYLSVSGLISIFVSKAFQNPIFSILIIYGIFAFITAICMFIYMIPRCEQ